MVVPGHTLTMGKCVPPLGITLPLLSALILWSDIVNDDKKRGLGKNAFTVGVMAGQ